MSLCFYSPRARSFSPRNMHLASDKLPERPKTPAKRLRKYVKPEELQSLNELLIHLNQNKQAKPLFLPSIAKSPPKKTPTPLNNEDRENPKNSLMVKINFYLNGKIKDNEQKQGNLATSPNRQLLFKGGSRSKSPEVLRNQVFINSSKNTLLKMDENPLKFKEGDWQISMKIDQKKETTNLNQRFYNNNHIYQGLPF